MQSLQSLHIYTNLLEFNGKNKSAFSAQYALTDSRDEINEASGERILITFCGSFFSLELKILSPSNINNLMNINNRASGVIILITSLARAGTSSSFTKGTSSPPTSPEGPTSRDLTLPTEGKAALLSQVTLRVPKGTVPLLREY